MGTYFSAVKIVLKKKVVGAYWAIYFGFCG